MKQLFSSLLIFTIGCGSIEQHEDLPVQKDSVIQQIQSIQVPTIATVGRIINTQTSCGYNLQIGSQSLEIFLPSETEYQTIRTIMTFSGLPTNFDVYSARINNAAAIILNNKRYILYDPLLFQILDLKSKSYWTSVSIIAHEIGHHLSGHTLDHGSSHHIAELEADKFSGFVLYKMGATEEDAIYAISTLGTETDTESHPNKYKRVIAIREGWQQAANQRYQSAVPPPPRSPIENPTIFDYDLLIDKEISHILYNYYNTEYDNQALLKIVILEEKGGLYVQALHDYSKLAIKTGDRFYIDVGQNQDSEKWCMAIQREFYETLVPGRVLNIKIYEEGTVQHRIVTYFQTTN